MTNNNSSNVSSNKINIKMIFKSIHPKALALKTGKKLIK